MDQHQSRLKRLEALNRGPLRETPPPEHASGKAPTDCDAAPLSRPQRDEANRAGATARPRPASGFLPTPRMSYREPEGRCVPLEEVAPGREIHHHLWGPAYFLRTPARDIDADGRRIGIHLANALSDVTPDHWCPEPRNAAATGPISVSDVAFLDLETTGLSNTPLFLVGLMVWADGGLVVDQYFARDLSEEAAAIALFGAAVAGKRLLITFNGRSFDLPYLLARAAATGVPCRVEMEHLDLLRDCRRRWRSDLPNCRLQTLERHICGRDREDDLPSSQVPDAYYAYLRTGNAADIGRILQHNALDLLTLADLTSRILRMP